MIKLPTYSFTSLLLTICLFIVFLTRCVPDKAQKYVNQADYIISLSNIDTFDKLSMAYKLDTAFSTYRSEAESNQVAQLNKSQADLHENIRIWLENVIIMLQENNNCEYASEKIRTLLIYTNHLHKINRINIKTIKNTVENLQRTIQQQQDYGKLKLQFSDKSIALRARLVSIEESLQTKPCCHCDTLSIIRDNIIVQDCLHYLSQYHTLSCTETMAKQQEYKTILAPYLQSTTAKTELSQCISNWTEKMTNQIQSSINQKEIELQKMMKEEACCKIAETDKLLPDNKVGCSLACTTIEPEQFEHIPDATTNSQQKHYKQHFFFDKPFSDKDYRCRVSATMTINYQTCDIQMTIDAVNVEKL